MSSRKNVKGSDRVSFGQIVEGKILRGPLVPASARELFRWLAGGFLIGLAIVPVYLLLTHVSSPNNDPQVYVAPTPSPTAAPPQGPAPEVRRAQIVHWPGTVYWGRVYPITFPTGVINMTATGQVETQAHLPVHPYPGDGWYVRDQNHWYIWALYGNRYQWVDP